jgi:hypothetical protein
MYQLVGPLGYWRFLSGYYTLNLASRGFSFKSDHGNLNGYRRLHCHILVGLEGSQQCRVCGLWVGNETREWLNQGKLMLRHFS